MKRRRQNGEGSIYQRKDGRWAASFTVGINPLTGKPKRKVLYATSEKELIKKMRQFNRDFERIDFTKEEMTLKQWIKSWLIEYKKNSLKPRSFQRYYGIYENYIKDSAIGDSKLKNLKAGQIQEFINCVDTSPSNIKYIIRLIKSSLTEALNQDYIVKNPCNAIVLPRIKKTNKKKFLTVDEQNKFTKYLLEHIREDYNFMVYFDLSTGLREGELLGLEWNKINFEEGTIYVNKTYSKQAIYNEDNEVIGYKKTLAETKNDEVRYVPIPEKLFPLLKAKHRDFLKDKIKNPKKYKEMNLIFSNKDGNFLNDKTPLRSVKKLYQKLNISTDLTFHSLRHTYATRIYEQNGDLNVIQALLGHIDIDTTRKTYVHVSDKKKKEAAALLDNFLD